MAIKPLHNESELLAKIAEGDQRAFSEIFDTYYGVLGEYVFKLTKSLAITEEIVQDAFIKIWVKRNELKQVKSFSNFLFIICRNQTYDHLRKLSKERAQNLILHQRLKEEDQSDFLENPSESNRALIDNAIDKLPPQAQKVYLLSRDERMKYEEIAERLGISSETVKKHIQYAVNFIKKDVNAKIDTGIVLILLTPLILI